MKSTIPQSPPRALWKAYLELGKFRLSLLVLATTAAGYVLAGPRPFGGLRFFCALLGTAVVAWGVNGLNQWLEISNDGRMQRTHRRPLPSGRLSPRHALIWGVLLSLTGTAFLALAVNPLTAALGVSVLVLYLLFYTPMKQWSTLNTLVGAVCGAIPPAMGWTAATGELAAGAWVLAALLFVWQIPHFLALAWLYRGDYERGGFLMLPIVDESGRITCRMVILYSLALIPIALAVAFTGLAGWYYAAGSLVAGLGMSVAALQMYQYRTDLHARRVFIASIVYLPLLLGLMVFDRNPAAEPERETMSIQIEIHSGPTPATPQPTARGNKNLV